MFGGRYDSSSCSYATQKHESGSVSHKFNPFQQMDINQIGLVGSNNTSSGSNTKAWCNNDSEVQRGECGSGPLIKHDFTKFKLQRQKEYCFKHICILCVYLNNTSSLCDHIYTYTYSKLSIYNSWNINTTAVPVSTIYVHISIYIYNKICILILIYIFISYYTEFGIVMYICYYNICAFIYIIYLLL